MDKLNLILSTLSKFGRLCDDCISIETNILPRQTVNKICRNPGNLIVINREKGTCPTCNKYKINNSLNSVTSSISHKCEITHLTKKVISTSSYSTNKRNQEQSRASKQREKRRNSPSTVRFKLEIELLLEKADAQISYCMKRDLAAMTDMAFYKYRPKVIKIGLTKKEIIKGYVLVLSNANDIVLSKKALRELSKNQSQTLRTAAPRYGKAKDIWEHAIPAKVIVDELIKMIESSCFKGIDRLLELYEIAGQRPLTKEDNKLLDTYLNLKIEELRLGYEINQLKADIKEEEREQKQLVREAERESARIEKAAEKAKKEREIMEKLVASELSKLESSSEEQKSLYEFHKEELEKLKQRESRAVSLAQITRAGYIYVISNETSFGKGICKIGMTRRAEPYDRVKELGDASVPEIFDVHAFAYTEDAPLLENFLHKEFSDQRVNLVNKRKEFFFVEPNEVLVMLKAFDGAYELNELDEYL